MALHLCNVQRTFQRVPVAFGWPLSTPIAIQESERCSSRVLRGKANAFHVIDFARSALSHHCKPRPPSSSNNVFAKFRWTPFLLKLRRLSPILTWKVLRASALWTGSNPLVPWSHPNASLFAYTTSHCDIRIVVVAIVYTLAMLHAYPCGPRDLLAHRWFVNSNTLIYTGLSILGFPAIAHHLCGVQPVENL